MWNRFALGAGVVAIGLLVAQDWQSVTALPAVEMGALTPVQKNTVLKLLRENDCTCGCGMKLAECRVKDPNCAYSRGLAAVMVDAIKSGKSTADALAAAKASRFAHGPQRDKLLEDPVPIAVAGAPVLGPADAPITLVEFSDFQCPYCVKAVPELQAVMKAYPTQVKLIFKQFPLDSHSLAATAAVAAIAAHRQGKFWPLHDALFEQKGRLSHDTIVSLATRTGLDMKRFTADFGSAETRKAVTKDMDDGQEAGVDSTPTLFVDGQHYNGPITLAALKPVLDAELQKPKKTSASKAP
jgi:protein-disulfide isomerase